jgi:molybdate transport system regulatory protein
MAGTKGSKYYNVFLNYKIWLATYEGEGIMGDGRFILLKLIGIHESIRMAAEIQGISYRKAWGSIKKMEKFFDFDIVEKYRGGSEGGKTILTPDGIKLVEAWEKLQDELERSVGECAKKFFNSVNNEITPQIKRNNTKKYKKTHVDQ